MAKKIIGICGASGSGKTTQAKLLQERLGIVFKENSAGLILKEDQIKELKEVCPEWQQNGHKEVINLSHSNPKFGFLFQHYLLLNRTNALRELQMGEESVVLDRTVIDNMTYFQLQVCHNQESKSAGLFMAAAASSLVSYTHLIYIPTQGFFGSFQGGVEENGSRVANIHYQRAVDAVFNDNINRYAMPARGGKVLVLNAEGIENRHNIIKEYIGHE